MRACRAGRNCRACLWPRSSGRHASPLPDRHGAVKKDWLQSLQTETRRAFCEEKIAHSGVVITANTVRATLRDPEKMPAALERLKTPRAALVHLDPDRKGGGAGMDIDVKGENGVITFEPTPAGLQAQNRECGHALHRSHPPPRRSERHDRGDHPSAGRRQRQGPHPDPGAGSRARGGEERASARPRN